ncbi:MAG: ribosome maturation factor RimM, partial [Dehalococcoidia bacterium]
RAHAFAAGAPNLQAGRRVSIGDREYVVVAARPDREGWVLQLGGIGDRDAAERLRGRLIEAPDAAVLREDADSYFVHELVGLEVVTRDGESLGKITEVLQPGANDVYVVVGARGELLIPAIGQVVEAIDVGRGVMVITPLPGLLDIPQ